MTGATMQAAFVTQLGPADAIRFGSLPRPRPGPTDVLVAVEAVAVNPVDSYVRSGRYHTPVPLPFIVGRDLVGTVVEAASVSGFAPGERVWCNSLGHAGRQGSFADLAVVPAERLYRLPGGVDPLVAVAVAHPAATAYLGWFVHARLRAGNTVLVGGGAGNVGTAAVQMAALSGTRVIASARPEDFAHCRACGADVVLDYRDPQLAGHVTSAAPGGVDVVWDTSGHHDFGLVERVAGSGARVLVTAATAPRTAVPWPRLYTRDLQVLGFVISRATVADLAAASELVNHMLSCQQLTARIAGVLPLSQTALAHQRIESGTVRGRLLLRP